MLTLLALGLYPISIAVFFGALLDNNFNYEKENRLPVIVLLITSILWPLILAIGVLLYIIVSLFNLFEQLIGEVTPPIRPEERRDLYINPQARPVNNALLKKEHKKDIDFIETLKDI